jgi:O-antigen ligase
MTEAVSGAPAPQTPAFLEPQAARRAPRAIDPLARAAGWSFVLFAAAMPLAMAPMNVAGGLCVALTLAVWLTRRGFGPVRTPLDLPAVVWLAAMGLSTLLALDRVASASSLGKGLIPFAAGLAAWHALDRRRGAAAIAALLVSGSLAAAYGCAGFIAAGGRYPARAIGITGSWMTFGLQHLLLVSLACGIAISARGRAWRLGAAAAALVGAAGLAASFTRSAWLGLAAALAVLLGLRRPRSLLVLALVAAVAYVALPGDLGERLRSAFDPTHVANRERMLMWEAGGRAFRDHPVTGVGLQNLTTLLARYRSPEAAERPAHLHNSYLHVAVGTGVVGLLAFLALCVGLVVTCGAGPPGLRQGHGLGVGVRLGATAGAAGFLLAALFDHAFGDEQLLFLLFTLAGIAHAARGWGDDPHRDAAP